MYGNFSPGRGQNTTPRLPPITQPYQNDSALVLLDRSQPYQAEMSLEDRRARQLLEDQMKVISSVCKKLNQDIELLDSQLNEKTFIITNLEYKTNELQSNSTTLNKDLQFKLARYDNVINKLETDSLTSVNSLRDVQLQIQDVNRNVTFRMNEIDNRINELNNKFDSILMEQTMVLKNVEGDTVKQLQLIDGKTRMMLEDLRSQINQLKVNQDNEMNRMESRLLTKIDENSRNSDRYDRLDRKLEEYNQSMNKRFLSFEDEFQRSLNKITATVERLENKINKGIEDKLVKSNIDQDKLRSELKAGFENVQDSILALQKLVDGKIRLSEDKLEKEIEKIRKMVVLM